MKRILLIADGTDGCGLMAAAYLRSMFGARAEVINAGLVEHPMDERVVQLLAEDSLAVTVDTATLVDIHMGHQFDVVITLSDQARAQAPHIPCSTKLHQHFPDLASMSDTEEGRNQLYRVRNEIKFFCAQVAQVLLPLG